MAARPVADDPEPHPGEGVHRGLEHWERRVARAPRSIWGQGDHVVTADPAPGGILIQQPLDRVVQREVEPQVAPRKARAPGIREDR